MGDMISLVPTVGLFVTMNPGKHFNSSPTVNRMLLKSV